MFKGDGCSLSAGRSEAPETAIGFGNVWVKGLPRDRILSVLRPFTGLLQTVGLACADGERQSLSTTFFRAGAVRVCLPRNMSDACEGMPHDGEYPLRRYVKYVSVE